ncbi:MAG: hypothetical protein GXO87_10830 [Chlorobi bacterium]|nr:hypothetical protein [Chlorobiota bacterium]
METENKNVSKIYLISAVIIVLLGIILAIGYPDGGVKAVRQRERAVSNIPHRTETQKSAPAKQIAKKETQKKKRIQPVAPPSEQDDSQDEGC